MPKAASSNQAVKTYTRNWKDNWRSSWCRLIVHWGKVIVHLTSFVFWTIFWKILCRNQLNGMFSYSTSLLFPLVAFGWTDFDLTKNRTRCSLVTGNFWQSVDLLYANFLTNGVRNQDRPIFSSYLKPDHQDRIAIMNLSLNVIFDSGLFRTTKGSKVTFDYTKQFPPFSAWRCVSSIFLQTQNQCWAERKNTRENNHRAFPIYRKPIVNLTVLLISSAGLMFFRYKISVALVKMIISPVLILFLAATSLVLDWLPLYGIRFRTICYWLRESFLSRI